MRRSQLRVSFCYIESKATSYVGVILVERLSSTDSTEIDSDPNAIDNEHTEMSLRPRKKKEHVEKSNALLANWYLLWTDVK